MNMLTKKEDNLPIIILKWLFLIIIPLVFGIFVVIYGLGIQNIIIGLVGILIFFLAGIMPRWIIGAMGGIVGGLILWYLAEDIGSAVFGSLLGAAIFFILGDRGLEFAAGIFFGGAGGRGGGDGFGGGESGGGGAGRGF